VWRRRKVFNCVIARFANRHAEIQEAVDDSEEEFDMMGPPTRRYEIVWSLKTMMQINFYFYHGP